MLLSFINMEQYKILIRIIHVQLLNNVHKLQMY